MVILRFKVRSKSEKSDELLAVLAGIIPAARATEGVVNFDIARTLDDPDSFIATAVYDDGAALARQESAAEVHRAMTIFPESLVAQPERTIFDASISPVLV
jgi:quinol monooxygenase YgiN